MPFKWKGDKDKNEENEEMIMKRIKVLPILMLGLMLSIGMTSCGSEEEDGNENGGSTISKRIVNGVEFNMVKVVGGTFQMGATSEQFNDYEKREFPVHQVTLSDYYIGETEVTRELWKAVMGSNRPSQFSDPDQLPVECVTWYDCQEFIAKLNQLTGQNFRLPTEAEWEFAARGGNASKGYKYAGGDIIDDVAWYRGNSSLKTHEVGTKFPNELGLYDMSGNVYEWCQDWYGEYNYSSDSQINPQGPPPPQGLLSGSARVIRGGDWHDYAGSCRVSYRSHCNPEASFSGCGFRLAHSSP